MMRRTLGWWVAGAPPMVQWRPVDTSHFDVCVIGAGPAGIAAALRAVDYKKRVCLIEANRVGGCDLWNGALQSKTMWEMSNFLARANSNVSRRVYNTTISSFMELDEERMRQSLIHSSEVREEQILAALRAADVSLLYGRALFASPHALEVRNHKTKEYHTLTADYFIIATGSAPIQHPYVKVDHKRVVTSDEVMMMPLPKSMVIVGAGVLGSEFAAIYARLGKTKVYLLDKEERIMPKEDDDIVEKIQESMEKHGVVIHQDSMLYNMQSWEGEEEEGEDQQQQQHSGMREHADDSTRRGGVRYTIMHRKTRELQTFEVERALIAVGRRPNYVGLNLHNTKCEVRDGALVLDAFGRCSNHTHIYAIGDAANDSKLVGVGEAKGRLVVDHIYSVHQTEQTSHIFTRIIFLTIAVASVGMNERQCRRKGTSYVMARYSFELCSRAVAANSTSGFVKILATNDSRKTLLGVRAVGMNASTIIELASAAIQRKQSAHELCELLTAYPSVSQAFLECLRVILGSSTLKPGTLPGLVCQTWTPSGCERGRAYKPSTAARERKPDCKKTESPALQDLQVMKRVFHEKVAHMSMEELHNAKTFAEAVVVDAAAKVDAAASALTSSSSNSTTIP